MHGWNVISAVEIVVHEYLPVALDQIPSRFQMMEAIETQRSDPVGQGVSHRFQQGRAAAIQSDKHPSFPDADLQRNQAHGLALETADSGEVGRSGQEAFR